MTDILTEPLLFEPIFKEKVWGGSMLQKYLNKQFDPTVPIGESWEICGHGNDQSIITKGYVKGTSLHDLHLKFPTSLAGANILSRSFPLLIKFLDAHQDLSVQVHPDDHQVKQKGWGEFGKTECWYIVNAKKNAEIIAGFNRNVTKKEIKDAVISKTLDKLLNFIPVSSGDVLFIPAGTVHAILGETLIYEVQETSDITLRLYDWGRKGLDGTSRKLHLEEALEVIDTSCNNNFKIPPVTYHQNGVKHSFRCACRYFALEQYFFEKNTTIKLQPKKSFRIITVLQNSAQLFYPSGKLKVQKGQSVLIPAQLKNLETYATEGSNLLLASVPDIVEEVISPLLAKGFSTWDIADLGGCHQANDLIDFLNM
ncbi:class I mannose-6-phosphate isomerase [Chitinispirillales bacterium ANBcel5]|uniref:type I phosphomannose isomerase catalytic subunit n=1 Tax=Cellulosispirillum alkaliphilum TaxID=3039283 RepID=UPI002A577E34|nr:class I mannose-6-phosphate isomerase [Chitinispirillales bacterium ANBcel5]